ncbi:uncharacterized protein FIBRA_03927 [Fibroporia radiculosa]|uniref:Uncharacterized protein n=1 Tax=Fibroporia radiculosa TaxID=599839 RepID=J4I9W2_9APHY|nr:uncharacterized protein FIBRA_03927 [Fibroporia radiculosa]CCM01856.1 predicted protein [Fibroporia radiculosa]
MSREQGKSANILKVSWDRQEPPIAEVAGFASVKVGRESLEELWFRPVNAETSQVALFRGSYDDFPEPVMGLHSSEILKSSHYYLFALPVVTHGGLLHAVSTLRPPIVALWSASSIAEARLTSALLERSTRLDGRYNH